MNKSEILIDLYLQDPNCTMISPWYIYKKDENDIPRWKDKIERNPDNLKKLENMISTSMIKHHQQELIETLEKKIPSLYIDCSKKWDDDIMFFVFKEYIKQSQSENKQQIIGQIIGDHSIVTSSRDDRKNYIKSNQPSIEEIIIYYNNLLITLLQANYTNDNKNAILNFETDITFNGLSQLMEEEWYKYLYLYLDNIQKLSIEEQQRINTLLYTRWKISGDRWIRVKINNGQWIWKTRYSSTWHRIEATHDYSEISIHENELE